MLDLAAANLLGNLIIFSMIYGAISFFMYLNHGVNVLLRDFSLLIVFWHVIMFLSWLEIM